MLVSSTIIWPDSFFLLAEKAPKSERNRKKRRHAWIVHVKMLLLSFSLIEISDVKYRTQMSCYIVL